VLRRQLASGCSEATRSANCAARHSAVRRRASLISHEAIVSFGGLIRHRLVCRLGGRLRSVVYVVVVGVVFVVVGGGGGVGGGACSPLLLRLVSAISCIASTSPRLLSLIFSHEFVNIRLRQLEGPEA
jgi:hypothetical protein